MTYLNVTTMRVAARAYRPRVASNAYGRAIRLPSDWPIPRHTETPYFAGPRYRWDDAKIYDLSIRYSCSTKTHELRAAPAVEIADNRRDADVDSAASDLSKATPLQDVSTIPSDTHARSQLTAIMHVRDTVKNRHIDHESRLVPAAIVNPLGG